MYVSVVLQLVIVVKMLIISVLQEHGYVFSTWFLKNQGEAKFDRRQKVMCRVKEGMVCGLLRLSSSSVVSLSSRVQ